MNRLIIAISAIALLSSCASTSNKTSKMEGDKNQKEKPETLVDTTPKVTGIGGIFFFTDNPKETKDWYAKNLGFDINDWGSSSFESRNINRPRDQFTSM